MDLNGKTAIITGSTSGIGLAIAQELAAHGANIVLNGLGNADEIETLRRGIEQDHGVGCRFHGANMLVPAEIRALVALATTAFGRLDILVNNAGIQHVAPIEEFPEEKFDAIIAINLTAAFHAIKAAIPPMKAGRWGRIINIASAHALVASPYKSAYVAAKHGIAGLTKSAALELAEAGITVNAVAPGYVWTPLVEKQIPEQMAARNMTAEQVKQQVLLAAQPTRQFVTMAQIASITAYLASDAAASITGTVLPVDGGWTAH